MNSTILHSQWAQRPDDQRFLSVQELHDYNTAKRAASSEAGVALDRLRLTPTDGNQLLLGNPAKGPGAALTHWSFGQLCQRAKAPAGYLRSLPAHLAAIPLQWSLEQEREDAKILARRNGEWTVDAITSGTYGRIWDAEVSGAVMAHVDLARWKVPAASYASSDPKRATTLYASDRDMFMCLVDDSNPIVVPGAEQDTLYRGIIIRNSEVGAATLEMIGFLYRYICDNRTIWGMEELTNLRIRHTSGGPMRFMQEAQPAIRAYLQAPTTGIVEKIKAASLKEVGKTEAEDKSWLADRGFSRSEGVAILDMAQTDPANPRSVWGLVQGATAVARDIAHGDERLDFERKASRIMEVF